MPSLGPLPLLTGLTVAVFVWAAQGVVGGLLAGYAGFGLCSALLSWRRSRVLANLAHAKERWDAEALDALIASARRGVALDPGLALYLQWETCVARLVAEDWAEALRHLSAFARDPIPERLRFAAELNQAWCRSQLGERDAALADALDLHPRAQRLAGSAEAIHAGVLGALFVRAGRPNDAVAPLQRGLAEAPAPPALQGLQRFHLAEAFLELDRAEDARREYAFVAGLAIRASFVAQARARLQQLSSGPRS